MRVTTKARYLIPVFVLVGLFSGPTLAGASDPAPSGAASSKQPAADAAVWGMFAHLLGKRWTYDDPTDNDDAHYRTCSWSVPDTTILVQEFKSGKLWNSFTVARTANPSEFDITYTAWGRSSTRKAHLQADGSFLLLHDGFMKPPTHMLIKDGRWEEDNVKLDDSGGVAKVNWSNVFSDRSAADGEAAASTGAAIAHAEHVPSQPIIVSVPGVPDQDLVARRPPTGDTPRSAAATRRVPAQPIIVSVPDAPAAVARNAPTTAGAFGGAAPRPIVPGKHVAGRIVPGKSGLGCYQIDVPRGQALEIRLSSRAFAPTLQVARGALCQDVVPQKEASSHAGKPATLAFESAGGRYLILVQPPNAGARGAYDLSVTLRRTLPTTRALAAGDHSDSHRPSATGAHATTAPAGDEDPRMALMQAQVAKRHAELAAEEAQRQEEARQRLLAEERQREQERIERQQAAANRQANFDAFMGGLQTVSTALQESNDYAEQQRQQAYAAAQEQREQQNRQMQAQQAAQAAAQQQQQAAAREAAARQLVAANTYRAQQMANTRDAATLQRLQADNQRAMLAARQIGMEQQVAAATARATQAAADTQSRNRSNQLRLAQQQDEQRRIAEQQQRARKQAEQQQQNERLAAEQRRQQDQAREQQRQVDREQAARQQQQALANHLLAERNGIRLRALTCPGGHGSYYVAGTRPRISPQVANCITVQYEARCPGVPRGNGVRGTAYNFVGGDSCLGDTTTIPALSCAADQVTVEVRQVTTCR